VNEPDLWMLSINAFAAVVIILSLLGGALRLLTTLFPVTASPSSEATAGPARVQPGAPQVDATLRVVIEKAVRSTYPGSVVLEVHEREQGTTS